MDTGDASRRRFGLVTRVNVRITETTFPLVRAYPRGLLELQRIGDGAGDQRFRQSMSLAVSRNAMASES